MVTDQAEYLFNLIDGGEPLPALLAKMATLPHELRRGELLEYAFDQLEQIGGDEVASRISSYIDENIDLCSAEKYAALMTLGGVGGETHELMIYRFWDSTNCNLSFAALVAMSEMLVRDVLSKEMRLKVVSRLENILIELNCSVEEAVECARILKLIHHRKADELIKQASVRMSEFEHELASVL